MRHALLPLTLGLLLTAATPALALEAPGRVAHGVAEKVPVSNVDAGGAGPSVALPDGGVVTVGGQYGKLVLTALTPSGALNPRFGRGGVSRPTLPVARFDPLLVLRRLNGEFRVVGAIPPPDGVRKLPQMGVLGLHADGSVDRGYGADGIAQPGIETSCGGCPSAAFAPDGSLLLTGGQSGPLPGGITAMPDRRWGRRTAERGRQAGRRLRRGRRGHRARDP